MARVSKLLLILVVLSMGFSVLVSSVYAKIIRSEGSMESTVTVYVTKGFNAKKGSRNLTYRTYLPADFSEQLKTQEITEFRRSVVPNPTSVNETEDKYGNSVLELSWNREVGKIHLEMQFTAHLRSLFPVLNSDSPFPLFLDEREKKYLVSTPDSPSSDLFVNYIGRAISQNLLRELDVVESAFLWIDRNIRLSRHPENKGSSTAVLVLKSRSGDEEGICNLMTSLLKGMGIPARVAYGISVQREMVLAAEKERYLFDQPNGERYWVEVYFPDLGWVSYDPRGYHFGSSSRVIRFSCGPDSESASERWSIETGEARLEKEYIYDIKSDAVRLTYAGSGALEVNKLVLSPVLTEVNLYSTEPNMDIEGLKIEASPEDLGPGVTGMIIHNSSLQDSMEIVATRNMVYAQRVTLSFPAKISEMKLPLIKLGDSGKLWIEVYADNGGVPGQLLLKSGSVDSTRVRFMMINNPWLSFPFAAGARLDNGSYWFALRSSGKCLFHWYAKEGNVTGTDSDTRSTDASSKKQDWENILNLDMCFQMIGSNETLRR